MPQSQVQAKQISPANLRNISFNALPTLGSSDRGLVWCPDHPVFGATDLWWDGSAWIVNDYATSELFALARPASGTTITTQGCALTNSGTVSTPSLTSTSRLSSTLRSLYTSAAPAGSLSFQRIGQLIAWRGNAARLGGFSYSVRFATEILAAGNRAFVGLTDSISSPTNIDPLANATPGKIGVGINTNTGNWFLIRNATGSAPTTTDLGSNFPVNTSNLYELNIFCDPNSAGLFYRVVNLTTNTNSSGFLTTSIPANTSFLAPQFWMTNNAATTAVAISCAGWQLIGRI